MYKHLITNTTLMFILLLTQPLLAATPLPLQQEKIYISIDKELMTADIYAIPIQNVIRQITKQTGIKFYIDPDIQHKITLRLQGIPIQKAIKRITNNLNTAILWDGSGKDASITAVHILRSSTAQTQLQEVITTSIIKPAVIVKQQTSSNVPSSQSIYIPRPAGESRQFINEERDGVEVSYVADELLLRLDPEKDFNGSIRALNIIINKSHGVLAMRMHRMRYLLARFAPGVNIQQVKKDLLTLDFIQVAEPNYVSRMAAKVQATGSWYLQQINTPKIAIIDKPSRYPIAIIDSGVDYTVPELKGMVIKGADIINNDADPMDDNGHGTAMAILAHQVAPNSPVLAIKVLDAHGVATYADIVEAIYQALDNKIAVIN